MEAILPRVLIWDMPVYLLHVVLAAGFLTVYFIMNFFGEDSEAFPFPAVTWMTLVFAVFMRFFWGLYGAHRAKFNGFDLHEFIARTRIRTKKRLMKILIRLEPALMVFI